MSETGRGDTVTRYVLLLFIINDRLCVYGGIRYARVRTPTATIFYSGRDGGGLYFLLLRMHFFASSADIDKRSAFDANRFKNETIIYIILLSQQYYNKFPRVFEISKLSSIDKVNN